MSLIVRYKEECRDTIVRVCVLECLNLGTPEQSTGNTTNAGSSRSSSIIVEHESSFESQDAQETTFVAAAHIVEAIEKDDLFKKVFPYRKMLWVKQLDGDTITRDLMRIDAKPVPIHEPIEVTIIRDSPGCATMIRDCTTTIALGTDALPTACVNRGVNHKVRMFKSELQGFKSLRANESAITLSDAKPPFAFLVEIAPPTSGGVVLGGDAEGGVGSGVGSASSQNVSRDFIDRGQVISREGSAAHVGGGGGSTNALTRQESSWTTTGSPTTLCETTAAELFVFSQLADARKILHDVHFHSQSLIEYEIGRRNDWQFIKVPDTHELILSNKRVKDLVRLGIPQNVRPEFYSKIGAADLLRISHHRMKLLAGEDPEQKLATIIAAADEHFDTVLLHTFRLIESESEAKPFLASKKKDRHEDSQRQQIESTAGDQEGNNSKFPVSYIPRFVPTFEGDISHICKFLTQGGQRALKLILCALAERQPDVHESPMLSALTGLFCLHLRPSQAFLTTMTLLSSSRHNKQLQGRIYWLKLSKTEYYRFVALTASVLRKKVPQRVFATFDTINDVSFVIDEMLREFFCKTFPLAFVSRILDSFVCEGHKVLIRFVVAVFKFCESELTAIHGTQAARDVLLGFPGKSDSLYVRMNSVMFNQMSAYAFSLNIKRNELLAEERQCDGKGEALAAHRSASVPPQRCIRRRGKMLPSSDIVKSLTETEPLWLWLPQTSPCVERIFSIRRDSGESLRSLYTTTGEYLSKSRSTFTGLSPRDCLIIIECAHVRSDTEEGENRSGNDESSPQKHEERVIVGVYLQDAMPDGTKQKYIGSPQSFVFILQPEEHQYRTAAPIANKYFLLCEAEFLTIGGGSHGGAALRIGSDLKTGTSTACETFNTHVPVVRTEELGTLYEQMMTEGKFSPNAPDPQPRPPSTSFSIVNMEVFSVA